MDQPDETAKEAADELPTLPPPPVEGPVGLRWANPGPKAAARLATSRPASPVRRPQAAGNTLPPRLPPEPPKGGSYTTPTLPLPSLRGGAPQAVPVSPSGPRAGTLPRVEGGDGTKGFLRRGRRRWLVAAGATVAAAAAAAAALATLATSAQRSSGALGPAEAFASLVVALSHADTAAQTAAAGACPVSAPASARRQRVLYALQGSEAAAQGVLAKMAAEKATLLGWPPGRTLYGELASVARLALEKDAQVRAWLVDLQATGCYSAPGNNWFHQQALLAAVGERAASQRLAGTWRPLARRYHLKSPDAI